jgi:hypothetical protein
VDYVDWHRRFVFFWSTNYRFGWLGISKRCLESVTRWGRVLKRRTQAVSVSQGMASSHWPPIFHWAECERMEATKRTRKEGLGANHQLSKRKFPN